MQPQCLLSAPKAVLSAIIHCMRAFAIVVVTLFFIPLAVSNAQLEATLFNSGPQIELQPAYPEPYSTARATLNDYSIDASGATISWRINGTVVKAYENQRSVEVAVGALGTPVPVEAILSLPDGSRLTGSKTITPHYLDLIVEPQTRVPAFYRGRALPSTGSTVNVTALVDGGAIPRSELTYHWRLNNTSLLGGAVRAQNQVSFTMPPGGGILEVVAEHPTQGTVSSKSIQLISSLPQIRFYEVSSLYGTGHRPITTLTLTGNSTTVRAEPFHLDLQTFNTPDLAEWTVGNSITPGNNNPYEVTLLRQGGVGTSIVGFHVRNLTQLLQGAQGGFSVQ